MLKHLLTLENLRKFLSLVDHVSTGETLFHDRESCDVDFVPID